MSVSQSSVIRPTSGWSMTFRFEASGSGGGVSDRQSSTKRGLCSARSSIRRRRDRSAGYREAVRRRSATSRASCSACSSAVCTVRLPGPRRLRHTALRFEAGAVGPLGALVANAGSMSADVRAASADGYEMTFAVNYLAHAQLIGDLLGSFTEPARIVLLGSNTYHANIWRRLLHVPAAEWRDTVELALPATGEENPGVAASGVAYSNAKLAILY